MAATGRASFRSGSARATCRRRRSSARRPRPLSPADFFVTIGGMHAIEIATRLIVGPGEEALVPTPAWPNFVGALEFSGARAVPVRLDKGTRWSLDPAKLERAVTPLTRLIFL